MENRKGPEDTGSSHVQRRNSLNIILRKKIIAITAEILQNNFVNEYLYFLFLALEFICILENPLRLLFKSVEPPIDLLLGIETFLYEKNFLINIVLNIAIVIGVILFTFEFVFIKMNKENHEWYHKIAFKLISVIISIFSTSLAIPYLQSSIRYLTCHEIDSCFGEENLYMFLINVPLLLTFLCGYYYHQKCLDLNFNIPIDNFNVPWTTLRPQSIFIPFIIHLGTALTFVFEENIAIVVVMQIAVMLALLMKNYFKHKNSYHIVHRINIIDLFLNSFLFIMVLMGILVSQIDISYTYNSIYLVLIVAILYSFALIWVHGFKRNRAMEMFFLNFQNIQEDVDSSVNSIIDFLCSQSISDSIKIKGLIQLITNEGQFKAQQKNQTGKAEKARLIMHKRHLSEKGNKQERSVRNIQNQGIQQSRMSFNNPQIPSMRKDKQMAYGMLNNNAINETRNTQSQFFQNKKHYDQDLDTSQISLGLDQESRLIQNETINATLTQTIDGQYRDFGNSLINSGEETQAYEMADSFYTENHGNTRKDVNLILESINAFLAQMKSKNINTDKITRIILLKVRLMYVAHQQDKLHQLMYIVSSLKSFKSSISVQIVAYIMQKKFQSIFKQKMQEKKDRMTPTTLVFYEHQREHFEQQINQATQSMIILFQDLKLQNGQSEEITKRFNRAKDIIRMTIELEKKFKSIVALQAQQSDLVGMYFQFLDQVVHMENEARAVYKVLFDLNSSNKINRRFDNIQDQTTKSRSQGFILVSGNANDLGKIIKLNNTLCNQLYFFKDDVIGKKIEFLLPESIARFHQVVAQNYFDYQNKANNIVNTYNSKIALQENKSSKIEKEKKIIVQNKQDKWHLTQKSKVHILKTKQGTILPQNCIFDIYFDMLQGIQFLCLLNPTQFIRFEEQKIDKSFVYIIQTNSYGKIERCSLNFINRFGILQNKLFDEGIDISIFNEKLIQVPNKDSDLDSAGIPLMINFIHLKALQTEESKSQIERYHSKIAKKGFKQLKQSSLKKNVKEGITSQDSSFDVSAAGMSLPYNSIFSFSQSEYNQICFTRREIIQKYSQKEDLNHDSLVYIDASSEINISAQRNNSSQDVQAMVFYLVFSEGMTSQMREQAIRLYEEINQNKNEQIIMQSYNDGMIKNSIAVNTGNFGLNIGTLYDKKSEGPSKQTNSMTSDDQFTFASTTSSSANSSSKDKVTELKNESFLSQIPIFVSLFRKVFIFYFILFVIVGTVILVVSFDSNSKFFNDINAINVARQLMTDMTFASLTFRAFLNILNEIEPQNSSILSNRYQSLYETLSASNEKVRLLNNQMRFYVKDSGSEDLKTSFIAENIEIYELSEKSSIITRNMSLDQSLQLLTGKIQSFLEQADVNDLNKTKSQLKCNCSHSSNFIMSRYDQIQRNPQIRGWTLIEREAYWIIGNTNKYLNEGINIISNVFLADTAAQVDQYKQQILILAVCCVILSFLCSVAFMPFYLRIRRNLNFNIFLIEKIQPETIQDILLTIQTFHKQLNYSLGKFGGNGRIELQANSVQDNQAVKANQLSYDGQKRKKQRKGDKTVMKNEQRGKIIGQKENLATNQMSLGDQPIHRRKQKNSQYTYNTYKTTENLGAQTINDIQGVEEEFKHNENQFLESDDSSNSQSYKQPKHRKELKSKEKIDENHIGIKLSDQEKKIQEKDKLILKEKKRSLSQMYFKQKVKSIVFSLVFSIILSVFFVLDYFLVSNTFDESVLSIEKFQAFYEQDPCFLNSVQLYREQLIKNETGFWVYQNFTEIEEIFQDCFRVNEVLRKLKQSYPRTLDEATDFLRDLDSEQYCDTIVFRQGDSSGSCKTDLDGVFKNGFNFGYSSIFNHFYMSLIRFQALKPIQRTSEFLRSEITNQKSVDFIMMYLKYMDQTLNLVKIEVTQSFNIYYDNRTRELSAVYAVFILVLVFSIILILFFVMKGIQNEIYLARKTIQLIPHKELIKPENYEIASKIKY